jgi:hypothetical protein
MTSIEHQQLKQALHIDLASVLFGMVKSKRYTESDIIEMQSFIAVRFVNIAKGDAYQIDSADLEIILENTFDFTKNLIGGVIDSNFRSSVTNKYYELLKVNPELIEKHVSSVTSIVWPFIK